MSTLTSYNGLQVVTPSPTGDGGLAINNNFKALSTHVSTLNPTVGNDSTQSFAVGSDLVDPLGLQAAPQPVAQPTADTTADTVWTKDPALKRLLANLGSDDPAVRDDSYDALVHYLESNLGAVSTLPRDSDDPEERFAIQRAKAAVRKEVMEAYDQAAKWLAGAAHDTVTELMIDSLSDSTGTLWWLMHQVYAVERALNAFSNYLEGMNPPPQ
jgi:hypothetical protein